HGAARTGVQRVARDQTGVVAAPTGAAALRPFARLVLGERVAVRADVQLVRVPAKLRRDDLRVGQQRVRAAAVLADVLAYPDEVAHSRLGAAAGAGGRVQVGDPHLDVGDDLLADAGELVRVYVLEFALDDPARHRVRVEADHRHPEARSLEQG